MAEHEHEEKSHGGGGHGGGGHGGGGGHEEHEGAPEWLISFADNVMLQMGLFVILLAMNIGIKAKGESDGKGSKAGGAAPDAMLDFALAVRSGFNSSPDMNSSDPVDQALIRRMLEKKGKSEQPGESGSEKESQATKPTDYSSMGGTVPFEDGSDALNTRARDTSQEIGRRLAGVRWIIVVRGHASPSEGGRDFKKLMDLTHRRALAVAQALIDRGVKPEQIRVEAAGANDRKTSTYDRDLDRINQRVDVIVTQEPMPEDPFSGGSRPGAKPASSTPSAAEPSRESAAPEH